MLDAHSTGPRSRRSPHHTPTEYSQGPNPRIKGLYQANSQICTVQPGQVNSMLEVPDLLVSEINPNDSLAMMRSLRSTTEDSNVIPKVSKVIPPEVNCHHVSIAGKHFLSIKVSNASISPVVLKEAQVLVNKNELQIANSKLVNTSDSESTCTELSEVVSKVSVKIPMKQLQSMPLPLLPFEEFVFLCHIELQSAQISGAKFQKFKIPLLFALTFQADIEDSPASMRAQYHLPKLRLHSPSFIMHTECSSPVEINQSFTVTYTIQNNLQDFMGITLAWMPNMPSTHDASADTEKFMAINEALVCQQPITELGVCKKGSTLTAKVEFQALRTGVHEVGKYMKLKLQYAVSSPSMPASSGTLLSKSSVSMSSATPFLPTLKSPPSVKSSIQSSPPWVKYSPPPCSSQPKSSSPVTKVPLMRPHSQLSTSQSQSYDVPVVEQGMMGRPPLVRYLSQNQIKSLQAMKPRQRLSARSQSYGGEIIPEEEGQSLDVDRPSTSRKLSETTMGGSSLQRTRKSSYVDRIVKHPCQVFVVKTGQL